MNRVEELSAELNARLALQLVPPAPAARVVPVPPIGIHEDIPMDDYLAMPCMSASGIEVLRRSPLQYRHWRDAPQKRTATLERGTALHLAVLEPSLFADHYVVLGQCEGITGKRERCRYNASIYRAGKHYCGTHDPARGQPMTDDVELIGGEDYARVLGMRDAVRAHPRARSLFEGEGFFEVTCIWRDEESGVVCKARPDRLVERARMLVDVKSSRSASPREFPRLAENLGYFTKLCWYRRALRALGWPYEMSTVLAIEPEAPHDLAPYLMDERSLDSVEADISRLLRLLVWCQENDCWPGYANLADGFLPLERPQWAQERDA